MNEVHACQLLKPKERFQKSKERKRPSFTPTDFGYKRGGRGGSRKLDANSEDTIQTSTRRLH